MRTLERELRQQLAELGPEGIRSVVAHFWLPSGLAVARVCAGRVPFEVYGHGTDVDVLCRLPRPLRVWIASHLRHADAIYLPSSAKRDQAIEVLGWRDIADKLHVESMGHAIQVEEPPARAPDGITTPYFLFLGRLIEQKGVGILLDAAQRAPGTKLVIAGEGPLRGKLERQAKRLGVDAQFVGWVSGSHKSALLANARALVVPSLTVRGLSEGAPLVIAEAHALGCPVIGSDLGGIAELGTRLGAKFSLFPHGDADALARALREPGWSGASGSTSDAPSLPAAMSPARLSPSA